MGGWRQLTEECALSWVIRLFRNLWFVLLGALYLNNLCWSHLSIATNIWFPLAEYLWQITTQTFFRFHVRSPLTKFVASQRKRVGDILLERSWCKHGNQLLRKSCTWRALELCKAFEEQNVNWHWHLQFDVTWEDGEFSIPSILGSTFQLIDYCILWRHLNQSLTATDEDNVKEQAKRTICLCVLCLYVLIIDLT